MHAVKICRVSEHPVCGRMLPNLLQSCQGELVPAPVSTERGPSDWLWRYGAILSCHMRHLTTFEIACVARLYSRTVIGASGSS
jgi:hypothetical protein